MASKSAVTREKASPELKTENIITRAQFQEELSKPGDPEVYADEKELRRILRRIDLRIIPYACLLYLLSFLDRVNIGQAKLAGMLTDLHLTNKQYQIGLTVFFVSYVAVEVPSNLALRLFRPNRWLALNMILWSITCVCIGLVKNAGQLYALRFLLGILEGGLFPGLNFILSLYYPREELGKRAAIFFTGATLAGAFGGLLAYGIRQMAGIGGKGGWSWIFILEGSLTFVCAIPAYWWIQDFPETANVLKQGTDRQKWLNHLLRSQGVTSAEMPFAWKHVFRAFGDWKCWLYAVLYIAVSEPFYSVSLFLPSIIDSLGFQNAEANALSAPPFALAFLATLTLSWYSDKYKKRGLFLLGTMTITSIGYIILLTCHKPSVSYFATFLTTAGVCPGVAISITWVGCNWGPVLTRATVMGLFFTIGNSGGIIASNVYAEKTAPEYKEGHAVALGFSLLTIACTAALMITHGIENRRRDRLYGIVDPDLNPLHASPEQLKTWGLENHSRDQILDLGDRHPGYRYML